MWSSMIGVLGVAQKTKSQTSVQKNLIGFLHDVQLKYVKKYVINAYLHKYTLSSNIVY